MSVPFSVTLTVSQPTEEPMALQDDFADAQVRVKTLSKMPSTNDLLELYALFKQGSAGDVQGKRPGMMDFNGRAKFDAWAKKKGMDGEQAMERYIALVDRLIAADK